MGMSSTEPDQDVTPALGAALAEVLEAPESVWACRCSGCGQDHTRFPGTDCA